MAITIVGRGSDTVPVSYNAISTVTISDAATTAGDTIVLTEISALPKDLKFEHSIYVSAVTGAGFTVSSSHADVPVAIDFNYAIINET